MLERFQTGSQAIGRHKDISKAYGTHRLGPRHAHVGERALHDTCRYDNADSHDCT
jgi:hypothetical protein